MKRTDALLALMLVLALPDTHGAPAAQLLAQLRQTYPNTRFDSLRRAEIPGLYEVRMGANVAYVSASRPRYFLFGRLYDARTGKDLTQASLQAPEPAAPPARIDTATLPLADAIRTTTGSGTRSLYVFTDPACPYCMRLDAELAKLADTTVYNFMVPFLGDVLPQAVWCAPDRQAAWRAAMQGNVPAHASAGCDNPIARNKALAHRLGVVGTPTILLRSGERIEGFASAAEIARRLAGAQPAANVNFSAKE